MIATEVWRGEAERTTIIKADSPLLNGLGGDDNDPSCGLRPIERRGRGVLEHGDTLDGVHIHIVDVVHVYDSSIYDEEREVGSSRERRTTTKVEVWASIRIRAEVVLLYDL